MATCAPSAMKRRAVARPMPLFPPVIRAFLPTSFIVASFFVCPASKYDVRHTCDMMTIIDGGCRKRFMRYPAEETAAKHERVVKEASRLFRERGFGNVSVAEVMKAAGLTHGAFYAHFGSKEELQAAAIVHGQALSRDRRRGTARWGKGSFTDQYLSRAHR